MEAAGEGKHFRLFMSALKDGVYQPAVALPFTAGEWGGVDAAVAPDESFLVYSSNRPPTPAQQQDLFIVFRKDGQWGEPQHLPDAINAWSPSIEARLGADGHTLYFTSTHLVAAAYPKSDAAAKQGLSDMQTWNTGLADIWRVDLTAYLQGEGK